MPSLGADMEAGTLVEWLVKPGDRVKRGDIVAVVETQKGAIEIEIFEDGQIEQHAGRTRAQRCRSARRWRACVRTKKPSGAAAVGPAPPAAPARAER